MAFYVLLGTAALHPSMRELTEHGARTARTGSTFGPPRPARRPPSLLAPMMRVVPDLARRTGRHARCSAAPRSSCSCWWSCAWRASCAPAGTLRLARAALRESGAALVTATNRDGHPRGGDRRRAGRSPATDAAIRMCDEPDDGDELEVVAAAGRPRRRASAARFPLTILQEWKRERLLENDAYVVRAYESTLRDPLAPARSRTTARCSWRRCSSATSCTDSWWCRRPRRCPRTVADSLPALSSQVALALESAALTEDLLRAAERGAVRLAGAELLRHRDGGRAGHDDPLRQPVGGTASSASSPSELEGTKFADLIHPDDKTPRAARSSPSMGDGEGHTGLVGVPRALTATAPTSSSRPCGPTCCTTRTSAASCSTPVTSPSARRSRSSCRIRPSTTR